MRQKYFGGILTPNEMFRDDLWWNAAENLEICKPRRIEVMPNPMVVKAQLIFRDALKK